MLMDSEKSLSADATGGPRRWRPPPAPTIFSLFLGGPNEPARTSLADLPGGRRRRSASPWPGMAWRQGTRRGGGQERKGRAERGREGPSALETAHRRPGPDHRQER